MSSRLALLYAKFLSRSRIVADPATHESAYAISQNERLVTSVIFVGIILLKLICAVNYRIDSDESQHLHVVWSWTQGMLPYRDVFDNHSPLFQLLVAPLFYFLGERPDILIPMRVAMIPLFIVSLWLVRKIGTTVFGPRIGLWAAVFTACFPPFFLTSTEFRPDNLWTVVWLLIVSVIIGSPRKPKTAFLVGLLLGIGFCVSMKSVLMLFSIACALCTAWTFCGMREAFFDWKNFGTCCLCACIGLIPAPAIAALYFVLHGSASELYQCVVSHNVLPGKLTIINLVVDGLRWLSIVSAPVFISVVIYRRTGLHDRKESGGWLFIHFVTVYYFATLKSFWQFLTAEDFLPFYPLLMVILTGALFAGMDYLKSRVASIGGFLPIVLATASVVFLLIISSPFENQTKEKLGIVADTLRLTTSDDFVMDSKGETIFRRRASRLVFEEITGLRLKRALMQDDIVDRLIATGAPVASLLRMPSEASKFIRRNYVPIAFRLRVLGQFLQFENEADEFNFDIVIPADYSILAENGTVAGTLNDEAWIGPRVLNAGHYCFRRTSGEGRLALIWTRAVQNGYTPFAEVKSDSRDEQD
jgi:hypothetical protein